MHIVALCSRTVYERKPTNLHMFQLHAVQNGDGHYCYFLGYIYRMQEDLCRYPVRVLELFVLRKISSSSEVADYLREESF